MQKTKLIDFGRKTLMNSAFFFQDGGLTLEMRRSDKTMNLIEKYETSPFWSLLGIKVDSVDENRARIKLKISNSHLNGNYILHGGVVTTLLDAVMGMNLKLNVGESPFATISLTTQFIKAVKEGETLFATAEIVQNGRSVVCMEARLVNENGDLVSIGLGTFKINRPRVAAK
jgi:uncharacterized protein (TIGR00369 family)